LYKTGYRSGFLYSPTHIENQDRVRDFGLEMEAQRFKSDVAALGNLADFIFPNDLTGKK
jgi:hypothetical protein